jgi:hypothetical protein
MTLCDPTQNDRTEKPALIGFLPMIIKFKDFSWVSSRISYMFANLKRKT